AVLGELVVDWLMYANHHICFSLADDTVCPTTLDALRAAGLAMFFADCVMIDVAHHIHHFAGYFFCSGGVTAMLVFLRDRQWCGCQSCDEGRSHCNSQDPRFIAY